MVTEGNGRKASAFRLVVVSNRLPLVIEKDDKGILTARPGSGGLVTALAPVLGKQGGLWIGWPGSPDACTQETEEILQTASDGCGFGLKPVSLTSQENDLYYLGFANEVVWPLFHDLLGMCRFEHSYWSFYQKVNRKFAAAIKNSLKPGDYVWIHDYHLMSVARELRTLGSDAKTGFFLHIPFPPLDIFSKLPWRFDLLDGLLHHDLIGFQTLRDRRNFVQCVRGFVPDARVQGKGRVVRLDVGDRDIKVGAFPISIDYEAFSREASTEHALARRHELHEEAGGAKILLGVDRLDYTKGIPERLKAFAELLAQHPELEEKVVFKQVVVPSRALIPKYQELKTEIEQLVGQINGRFSRSGWVPVHYRYCSLDREELVAHYRAADVAVVTPLKDGMNLIAKEYCAANVDESGALVLSEFAGAAAQLQSGALLVNPYDEKQTAAAIYRALSMSASERRTRMKKMRRSVKNRNIYWWLDTYLQAAASRRFFDLTVVEDYRPQMQVKPLRPQVLKAPASRDGHAANLTPAMGRA